ncbi:MAG: hypothetical protein GWN20_13545, partial [Phycisphaerae bacterium]|nr:hypothetical protein [Phycisphaerae bacterium]
WEKVPGPALALLPPDLTAYEVSDIFGLELVGEQLLDGEFLYHLRGSLFPNTLEIATGDVDGPVTVEYWLGREDGLLKQSTADMNITNIETYGLPLEGAES